MAGYIGSKASVVSSGVERKKTYSITGSTTSLTGLNYTVGKVHVFQNGVRLLDGTDYTATNGTSITLTVAAQSGDNVVVVSQASFQLSEHYTSAEADAEFVTKTGDTMSGNLNVTGTVTSDGLTVNASASGNFGAVISSATQYSSDALRLQRNGVAAQGMNITAGGESVIFDSQNTGSGGLHSIFEFKSTDETTTKNVLKINGKTNDISFYEDTGTTPKFFWDASAESLGIGTSSPAAALTVAHDLTSGGDGSGFRLQSDPTSTSNVLFGGSVSSGDYSFFQSYKEGAAAGVRRLSLNPLGGNVGIGTSSPSAKLTVLANSANGIDLAQDPDNGTNSGRLFFTTSGGSNSIRSTSGALQFSTGATAGSSSGTERMRIDSSGNLLVGKTATGISAAGHSYRADGTWEVRRDISSANSSTVGYLSRGTTDGNILTLYKDTTSVGSIGVSGGKMSITGTNNNLQIGAAGSNILNVSTASVYPDTDNSVDLGLSNRRFDDIFATNTSIIGTSDITEKQDIASLTATEMLVAARLSKLFKTFRWKDSVAEKGENARTHTGTMAQEVQSSFTEEGLDAGDYSLFVSNTWWEHDVEVPEVEAVAEVTDEDGNVTTEAVEAVDAYTRTDTYNTEDEAPEGSTERTRLGLRYTELLAFVGAYNEQRFASIEARLTALEA